MTMTAQRFARGLRWKNNEHLGKVNVNRVNDVKCLEMPKAAITPGTYRDSHGLNDGHMIYSEDLTRLK